MAFPIYEVTFYLLAAGVIASSLMVILFRNTVYSALSLVLTFFLSAILWMLLQAEFLSLALIFVYVGAVMTLFLFVVMMLNLDAKRLRGRLSRLLPLGVLVMLVLTGLMILAVQTNHYTAGVTRLTHYGVQYNNVTQMGTLLYTQYLYPFEIAAVILMVAIIAAISLAFHGRKANTRSQKVAQQHQVKKADRIRLVNLKAKKS